MECRLDTYVHIASGFITEHLLLWLGIPCVMEIRMKLKTSNFEVYYETTVFKINLILLHTHK
jgi:hypothetical protein